MRKSIAPLVALALLVTGCEFSNVKADATVTVSGRALTAAGTPLAGAQVRLFKRADLGEALVGTAMTVGSLGAVCLLPEAPTVCRQARVATTDASGRYRFTLKGSDTQGTIGTESTLDVVVADPKSRGNGASTTLSFKAKSSTVTVPDARLWRAAPRVSEGGGRINLSWAALPARYGTGADYSAQLFHRGSQASLWSQPASGGQAAIDARVLEDLSGTAAVTARTDLRGGSNTGDVTASYLSARLPVAPLAGPPPSRNRPCLAVTAALGTTTQRQCRVTDGNLIETARLTGPRAQLVTGVVVDLGTVRPVRLVVARGLSGMYLIEVSDDGRTYRVVGNSADTTTAISPPGEQSARYVRLRSPGGLDESLMTEVSVW